MSARSSHPVPPKGAGKKTEKTPAKLTLQRHTSLKDRDLIVGLQNTHRYTQQLYS